MNESVVTAVDLVVCFCCDSSTQHECCTALDTLSHTVIQNHLDTCSVLASSEDFCEPCNTALATRDAFSHDNQRACACKPPASNPALLNICICDALLQASSGLLV